MTDIKHSQLVRNWKLFLITRGIKNMHTLVVFPTFLLFCSSIIFGVCFRPTSSDTLNFIPLIISNSKVLTHQLSLVSDNWNFFFCPKNVLHELSINLILGSYKVEIHKNNLKSLPFLDSLNMYIHYFRSVRCIAFKALEVSNQSSLCWCRMSITLPSNFFFCSGQLTSHPEEWRSFPLKF